MEGLPPRVLSVNGDVAEKAAHGHRRSAAFKRTTEHTAQRRRQAGSTQTRPPSSLSGVLIKYRLLSQSLLIQPSAAPPDLYSSLCLGTIKCSSRVHLHTHTICFCFILHNLHPSLLCLLTPWAPNGAYKPQARKIKDTKLNSNQKNNQNTQQKEPTNEKQTTPQPH